MLLMNGADPLVKNSSGAAARDEAVFYNFCHIPLGIKDLLFYLILFYFLIASISSITHSSRKTMLLMCILFLITVAFQDS